MPMRNQCVGSAPCWRENCCNRNFPSGYVHCQQLLLASTAPGGVQSAQATFFHRRDAEKWLPGQVVVNDIEERIDVVVLSFSNLGQGFVCGVASQQRFEEHAH